MMLLTPDLPPQRHDDKSWSFWPVRSWGPKTGSNGQLPIWLTWIFILPTRAAKKR